MLMTMLIAAAPLAPAQAQQKLEHAQAEAVVAETNRLIGKYYLYPEKAGAITARLTASLKSGRYDVGDPGAVAERITEDMQAVTQDGHMNVRFDPARAKAFAAPKATNQAPDPDFTRRMLIQSNFGIPKMEVLPGNVRYVNVSTFQWDPELSPKAFDEAIRFLRGGDAYILDIRSNGGGEAEAVAYLISHFMEPDRKLMTFYSAEGSFESHSLKDLPAGRLEKKPLFLLISKRTFSAAEEFAAHVKNFKLGTIVGENTGGGGNNNLLFPLPNGFVASISAGRAVHAATGKSWQGDGIAPDIATPPARALDAAQLAALKAIAQSSGDPDSKARVDWMAQAIAGKDAPSPSEAQLAALQGRYDGGRTATLKDGKLVWQRSGGPEIELVSIGPDLFAVGEPAASARIRFNRAGGAVTSATLLQAPGGGPPEELHRLGS